MQVRLIKNDQDCAAALARIAELASGNLVPDSPEHDEYRLLSLVIKDYESRAVPQEQADPIDTILFYMDQMGLSRKDMVAYLGSLPRVSEILSRRRRLTLAMMRRLNEGLGIPLDILVRPYELERGAESVLVLGMGAAVAGILSRIMESVASEPSPFTLKNAGLLKAIALMFLPASAALFVLELLAGRGPAEAVFVLFGALLVSLVMYCLTIVFRYGAALQKESDETL